MICLKNRLRCLVVTPALLYREVRTLETIKVVLPPTVVTTRGKVPRSTAENRPVMIRLFRRDLEGPYLKMLLINKLSRLVAMVPWITPR